MVQQRTVCPLKQSQALSVLAYSPGLFTLSQTQVTRLEIAPKRDHEFPGCARDKPISAMTFMLEMASIKLGHRVVQIAFYTTVTNNERHPLHKSLDIIKGLIIKRGRGESGLLWLGVGWWILEADGSLHKVFALEEVVGGSERLDAGTEKGHLTTI